VRLAARLGFEIDPATAAAIRSHARDLQGVSRERIGDEIERMLVHPSRAAAVTMLEDLGLDSPILDDLRAHERPAAVRALAGLGGDAPYPLVLAAWALDRGLGLEDRATGQLIQRWRKALCLSNTDRDVMASILKTLGILEGPWPQLTVAQQKRLAGAEGPGFAGALSLLHIRDARLARAVEGRLAELAATKSGLCPGPLLTGDDLISMGFRPGPGFKGTLDRIYDAQLEERITTREDAMELARRLGV
jgi:poly(A) polymerase